VRGVCWMGPCYRCCGVVIGNLTKIWCCGCLLFVFMRGTGTSKSKSCIHEPRFSAPIMTGIIFHASLGKPRQRLDPVRQTDKMTTIQ
jgi:hypothetical protein